MRKAILEKAQNIKELGVINIDKAETNNGRITTFVPINVLNNELDELLNILCDDFHEQHPEVEKLVTTVNVVYIFGEIDSPRFELEILFGMKTMMVLQNFIKRFLLACQNRQQKKLKGLSGTHSKNQFSICNLRIKGGEISSSIN